MQNFLCWKLICQIFLLYLLPLCISLRFLWHNFYLFPHVNMSSCHCLQPNDNFYNFADLNWKIRGSFLCSSHFAFLHASDYFFDFKLLFTHNHVKYEVMCHFLTCVMSIKILILQKRFFFFLFLCDMCWDFPSKMNIKEMFANFPNKIKYLSSFLHHFVQIIEKNCQNFLVSSASTNFEKDECKKKFLLPY